MIRVTSSAVLMATFITGCTSVNREELEESGIAGKWKSGDSQMTIYCSNAFTNGESENEDHGTYIKSLQQNGFTVGPADLLYEVSEWPKTEDGVTQMTLDHRKWKRTERYRCV